MVSFCVLEGCQNRTSTAGLHLHTGLGQRPDQVENIRALPLLSHTFRPVCHHLHCLFADLYQALEAAEHPPKADGDVRELHAVDDHKQERVKEHDQDNLLRPK